MPYDPLHHQPDLKGNLIGVARAVPAPDSVNKATLDFAGVVKGTATIRSAYIRLGFGGRDAYGRPYSWDGVVLDDLIVRVPNPNCAR